MGFRSTYHFSDHQAAHIGQPEVAAHVAVSEPRVVEPQAVKQRSLQVVYMDFVLGDLKPESSVLPITCPPCTPPPATQTLKQFG